MAPPDAAPADAALSGPVPPAPARRPHRLEAHGDVRIDDWYWLADRDDPDVVAHLQAENAYTDAVTAPTSDLRQVLFEQIRARTVETDAGSPSRRGDWWYWSRTTEGLQYPVLCRRPDPGRVLAAADVADEARAGATPGEQVVLDQNALAGAGGYFALGVSDLSPDQQTLAYATDSNGSERYTLRFRHVASGADHPDTIEDVYYGSAWAADNVTFFYVRPDAALRPWQVWRHRLGSDPAGDTLVYQEDDERFFVGVGLTRSERYVVVHTESKTTSEAWWLDAADPGAPPAVVLPRQTGVEYEADHAVGPAGTDVWLLRTNRPGPSGEEATDFAVWALPVGQAGQAEPPGLRTVLPHRRGVKVESVEPFAGHVVVTERADGLERLRILGPAGTPWPGGGDHMVDQPEPVYSLLGEPNPEWESTTYHFGYTSLVTPRSSIQYDVASRSRTTVWVQAVRDYDPGDYRSERTWATAADGTRVPVSLVARRDQPRNGSAPCVIYGYGAYEITIDPAFSVSRLNLLERGATFAIAHVRGGGELGRRWYEQGRLEHKTNTFTDFVAVAHHLVDGGWADRDRIAIRGGSAGGLLMGAVINLAPDLWRAVVAEVPFVDVVTSMSDPSLPLTVTEWEEWGDPVHDPEAYRRMLSYSPYDNVTATTYPAMYVTAGLNDPRVGYWEPAKWVARVRERSRGGGPVLLRTELGAGHQGPSGRYDAWADEARVQAFVLYQLGLGKTGAGPAA